MIPRVKDDVNTLNDKLKGELQKKGDSLMAMPGQEME